MSNAGIPPVADRARELYGPTTIKFTENNLPDPSKFYDDRVTLMKEDLKRFRDQYLILTEFVAEVCDVKIEDLNLLEIIKYYYLHPKERS